MLNPSFITDEVYLGSHGESEWSIWEFEYHTQLLTFDTHDLSTGKQDETTKKERTFSFEDTVAELGTGRFHLFIMLICGSSFLSSVNEGLSLGFVLPYVKCDLQMTPTEQGLLNSVGFCGIILSSHFWGFMADTWGRKKVMQVSVITTFVFSAMSSVASNVWLMITLRFVVGLWSVASIFIFVFGVYLNQTHIHFQHIWRSIIGHRIFGRVSFRSHPIEACHFYRDVFHAIYSLYVIHWLAYHSSHVGDDRFRHGLSAMEIFHSIEQLHQSIRVLRLASHARKPEIHVGHGQEAGSTWYYKKCVSNEYRQSERGEIFINECNQTD